jgi:mono/diheme cytochrome c family protein
MQYPFWVVPFGYGVLMAVVGVLHVFISHFAIGGGFFLVVVERAARKAGDAERLEFLQKLSRFFVLTTLVMGALTGVGIWFVIGLLNPAATEVLIHNFVWGWAIEWTFFVVEILAAILYSYGWKRMSPADHMTLGWIYFVFAWLSLFVINGILTFMLTPGAWLTTGNIWDGFFNPTFWPSLVLRSAIAVMLAGLYALLVAARCKPETFKTRMVRQTAWWSVIGLAAALPSLYWYWGAIPATITAAALGALPTPMRALHDFQWFAAALAILLIWFGLIVPKRLRLSVAVLMMVAGLGWFGSFEWFRESIRKPYVIFGYMYANAVEVRDIDTYKRDGYLAKIAYRTGDDGADLFRHACRSCHTIQGYNSLKPAFDGTDPAFIAAIVQSIHLLAKGNMPPFLGTPGEANAIAAYLATKLDRRPVAAIYKLQGVALGEKVFQIRCGKCHPMGSPQEKTKSLTGLTQEDYENVLNNAAELGDGMPAFTGNETERRALIEYFRTFKAGGKP